jgi:hypothetical protein
MGNGEAANASFNSAMIDTSSFGASTVATGSFGRGRAQLASFGQGVILNESNDSGINEDGKF